MGLVYGSTIYIPILLKNRIKNKRLNKRALSFILLTNKSLLIMKFTTFIPLFLHQPSLEFATL